MSKNTQISDLINYISVDGSGNVVLSTGQLVATQNYVTTAVSNLVASAPSTLDTLNELATALGNDANFATTVTTSIATKQPQLNGTGFVKVSGTTVSYDNSTYLTTSSALSTYMPLSGGIFTGTTRMDGSGGTTPSITMIFNSGINRLLAPLLRLYGATNETSNYVELFGSLATQNRTIQLPDASGTIALTSNLSSYLPLTGGTLTGTLNGTSIYANGEITSTSHATFGTSNSTANVRIYSNGAPFTIFGGIGYARGFLGLTWDISPDRGIIIGNELRFNTNSIPGTTIGSTALTLASNQTATFASSVTANSGVQSQVIGSDGTYGASYPMYSFTGTTNGSSRIFCGTGSDFMYFAAGTGSGFQFRPNASTTASMLITSGGNVLIGTTTDNGGRLQVNGGDVRVSGGIRFSSSGTDANRWSVYWNGGTGDLIVVNNISDIRSKKDFDYNIKGLETIQKLKPLKFTWKDGTSHSTSVSGRLRQYGFIAQETMEADDYLAWHNQSQDTWGIEQYESFTAVIVKAIQELTQKVNALENK